MKLPQPTKPSFKLKPLTIRGAVRKRGQMKTGMVPAIGLPGGQQRRRTNPGFPGTSRG